MDVVEGMVNEYNTRLYKCERDTGTGIVNTLMKFGVV